MTVIHKYITHLFFKYFAIVLGVVIVIYLSIDFFGRIDKFLEAEIAPALIAAFFLYKIPLIVSQITPIAVLLGVLAAFGLMAKNNEIIALKSGGVSLHCLLIPIVVIGICLTVLLFVFSEVVVPISVVKANRIEEMRYGTKMTTSRGKNIWIRGDRSITHIDYYNPSDQMVSGISIAYFDQEFALTRRINAEKGKYIDGNWVFFDCLVQEGLDSVQQDQQVVQFSRISRWGFMKKKSAPWICSQLICCGWQKNPRRCRLTIFTGIFRRWNGRDMMLPSTGWIFMQKPRFRLFA